MAKIPWEPMQEILVVVDMQNDFLLEEGKLFLGHDTSELRKKVADFAYDFNGWVYVTRDVHRKGSCEHGKGPGQFPEHCLMDTWGASLVKEILDKFRFFWEKIWKESFSSEGVVRAILENYVSGGTTIHVVGVCTHICVHDIVAGIANYVKNVYKEVPKIVVHKDMIDDFDDEMASFALKRLQNLYGVEVRCGPFSKTAKK